jgi:hypothetical protein
MSAHGSSHLAKIHVLAKQAGLDDDTYRDTLERITGKRSAKLLTANEATAVIAHFSAGAPIEAAGQRGNGRKALVGPFAKKLQALWIAGWNLGLVHNRDDAALLAFVKRQTGLEHTRFLHDANDAASAIEALKGWLAREAGVEWSTRGTDMTMAEWQVAMAQFAILRKLDVGAPQHIAECYAIDGSAGDGSAGLICFAHTLGIAIGAGEDPNRISKPQRHLLMNSMGARIRKLQDRGQNKDRRAAS